MTLFRKLADREDGRLMAPNNHFQVLNARFFYGSEMRGNEETKGRLILQVPP